MSTVEKNIFHDHVKSSDATCMRQYSRAGCESAAMATVTRTMRFSVARYIQRKNYGKGLFLSVMRLSILSPTTPLPVLQGG